MVDKLDHKLPQTKVNTFGDTLSDVKAKPMVKTLANAVAHFQATHW